MTINKRQETLFKTTLILAQITVFYNLIEGVISIFFGLEDETLALFGFGVDSFVEVVSGIGIWHMILRIRKNESENPDEFEKTALKITGSAFYLLTVGLLATAGHNLIKNHHPETTFWGIVISAISLVTMWLLIHFKVKVGKELNSDAILSDANCTKMCFYLSVILLVSSAGYELTGIGGIDSAGALLIAWFSYREGKEAFEKAKGKSCGCGCGPPSE